MNKVMFVGAGPGDVELITIKGKKAIEEADIIIYAGSLVNPELLKYNKKNSKNYNSASLTLKEVIELIKTNYKKGKKVVRLHTGDPSLYGAIREQMDILDEEDIKFIQVPGVSSFSAAAASIKKEFTLPGVSQSLIITRLEGRTAVPKLESLELFATHKTSMSIFLSVQMIDDVVKKLLTSYDEDTPIAVIQRASWDDELVVIGTLKTIAEKVKQNNITKTAQILVGNFLNAKYELSKLYDEEFSHEYRDKK